MAVFDGQFEDRLVVRKHHLRADRVVVSVSDAPHMAHAFVTPDTARKIAAELIRLANEIDAA